MDYLHRHGGRFVCVMPRTRLEDAEFREWIQTHEPDWTLVRDRPNPRRRGGPRDRCGSIAPSCLHARSGRWCGCTPRCSLYAGTTAGASASPAPKKHSLNSMPSSQHPAPGGASASRSSNALARSWPTAEPRTTSSSSSTRAQNTTIGKPHAGAQAPIPVTYAKPADSGRCNSRSTMQPSSTSERATGCSHC